MASSVGEIGLDLVVNQGSFNRQMQGIAGTAKKAGLALAAAFSVKKLVDFGKSCVDLGSDLAEVQNVVDVTFPHMTAQVDKFAKSAASSFGLSETMAKQFTGTFGAMAKAFGFSESAAYDMSTALTGLAGDVASFYNLSQEEAYTKLKSVFTGETESLKDLGVVMTQSALDAYAMANGFGKATKDMTEMEKVALRYAFVQNQLSAASGDFARTADSWANQTRILKLQFDSLKATIGQGLINVLTPVLKIINQLLAKLMTLASAFKSFTEMLTGNKSDGGISNAAAGLTDATAAADGMADSTAGIGEAAKKAAKELNLMGFDKIQKVKSGSDSSSGSSGASIGGNVDYGALAEGETVADKLDSKMQGLIDRCKELGNWFKKGFVIGFGDSEERIKSIQKHISGIGRSLKEIFSDSSVTRAANTFFDRVAYAFGEITGSVVSIGVTIADNLVGGIDMYLAKSKEYIKKRLASIFDVSGEIALLSGKCWAAFANVFSVFSGENAKSITGSLIGIFSDSFLGITDMALKFSRDIIGMITGPFIDNQELIKETIDNTLAPIADALTVVHDTVRNAFSELNAMYEEHIAPMFLAFRDGFSEIYKTLLNGYNKHIKPVLDEFAVKFKDVFEKYVQPLISKGIDYLGKLADLITVLWKNVLQPVINWIAESIMPLVAPVLEGLGDKFLLVIKTVSEVASGLFDILGGIVDFLTGVFSGDWKKAWTGIKNIFKGIWDTLGAVAKAPINGIISMINGLVSRIVSGVNLVISTMNKLSFDVPDWIPGIGGETFGFNIGKITAPKIPYLAQGGFVKANTPRLAVIGDNRQHGEIVAPEDKMQAMVDAAVRAAVSRGITKADLESVMNNAVMRIIAALASMGFYVDGEELAKAVLKAIDRLDNRMNPVKVY